MAKNPALSGRWMAIGALALCWGVNWAVVRVYGYPFIYCWTPTTIPALYIAYGTMILYVACAYTAFQLLRGRIYPALGGALFITAIIELPRLADMAFRMGGSCG